MTVVYSEEIEERMISRDVKIIKINLEKIRYRLRLNKKNYMSQWKMRESQGVYIINKKKINLLVVSLIAWKQNLFNFKTI